VVDGVIERPLIIKFPHKNHSPLNFLARSCCTSLVSASASLNLLSVRRFLLESVASGALRFASGAAATEAGVAESGDVNGCLGSTAHWWKTSHSDRPPKTGRGVWLKTTPHRLHLNIDVGAFAERACVSVDGHLVHPIMHFYFPSNFCAMCK